MHPAIPGFHLIEEFVSQQEERALLETLLAGRSWEIEPSAECRRVQHYGYRYHFRTNEISEGPPFQELPELARTIGERIGKRFDALGSGPNQVTVNEYQPGQTIAMHTDQPAWGACIATLSLNIGAELTLRRQGDREMTTITLPPRALTVLSGAARYTYRHGIKVADGADNRTRTAVTYRRVEGPWRR